MIVFSANEKYVHVTIIHLSENIIAIDLFFWKYPDLCLIQIFIFLIPSLSWTRELFKIIPISVTFTSLSRVFVDLNAVQICGWLTGGPKEHVCAQGCTIVYFPIHQKSFPYKSVIPDSVAVYTQGWTLSWSKILLFFFKLTR